MKLTSPADLRKKVLRYWERGLILATALPQEEAPGKALDFPLRLPIKGPSSAEIADDFAATAQWIDTWQSQKQFEVEWRDFSHRLFGKNQMPAAIVISDAATAAKILGLHREWNQFLALISHTKSSFPGSEKLLAWLAKHPLTALKLADDWTALLAAVDWIRRHPHSDVYLRQMDAPGVHTKLVEGHRKVLSELLDLVLDESAIDTTATGAAQFARRYGFREKPERIRLRFLDPSCAIAPDCLGLDLTLTASFFAQLNPRVKRVFITENEVNFLAFPMCPDSLLIFGAGYGWETLRPATWLHGKDIYYWGDLDTHGFAILSQLRNHFPHAQSLLMESSTLLRHRALWTSEPKPVTHPIPNLTPTEESALRCLRQNDTPPRLEQEKLPFSELQERIRELLASKSFSPDH